MNTLMTRKKSLTFKFTSDHLETLNFLFETYSTASCYYLLHALPKQQLFFEVLTTQLPTLQDKEKTLPTLAKETFKSRALRKCGN